MQRIPQGSMTPYYVVHDVDLQIQGTGERALRCACKFRNGLRGPITAGVGGNTAGAGSLELQGRVEECSEQYKRVERERKKTEAELARHNLGRKISSANAIPIPRLPTAPSRLDRMVVDFFREHARVSV